jgi:hypothetical protein
MGNVNIYGFYAQKTSAGQSAPPEVYLNFISFCEACAQGVQHPIR